MTTVADARLRGLRLGGATGLFFGLKLAIGLLLLTGSARWLGVAGFASFSQAFLYLALVTTLSAGGAQNGVVREVSAGGGREATARILAGALLIWACVSGFAILVSVVAAAPLSRLLVGNATLAATLPWLTSLAMLGGAGLLPCAVLTGTGRAPTALLLQAVGLLMGGVGAVFMLSRGEAANAVIAFAGGATLTTLAALIITRRDMARVPWRVAALEARRLLAYSVSFAAVAVITPVTLFALRAVYRDAFGAEALGLWLAANRISDVTSQLLGLFMVQAFVPAYTSRPDLSVRAILQRQTLAGGIVVFGGGSLLFWLFSDFWVRLVLGTAFIPAIPFILAYMIGDTLRVAVSIRAFSAFADRRLRIYVAIEAAAAAALAVGIMALTWIGRVDAPVIAYPVAYAVLAAALEIWRLRESNQNIAQNTNTL